MFPCDGGTKYKAPQYIPERTKNGKNVNFDAGAMIVMDKFGNLFFERKKRNEIHHSSLIDGEPVAYAGMFTCREDDKTSFTRRIDLELKYSGHYPCNEKHKQQYDKMTTFYDKYVVNMKDLKKQVNIDDFSKFKRGLQIIRKILLDNDMPTNQLAFAKFVINEILPLQPKTMYIKEIIPMLSRLDIPKGYFFFSFQYI